MKKSLSPTAAPVQLLAAQLFAGAVLAGILAPRLDGFWKGMAQGAGITIIVLSAFLLGAHLRATKRGGTQDDGTWWLPSQEAASRNDHSNEDERP